MIQSALRAAAEESRHTQACLNMAARYDGATWDMPALPVPTDQVDDKNVSEFVRETWMDGCIGEGLAAELARARAAVCPPERGRDVLSTIAAEENRHAALGFEILKYMVDLEGHRGEIARAELAHLLRHAHAPAFIQWRDRPCEAAEGRPSPRLGATLDRSIERGRALLASAC